MNCAAVEIVPKTQRQKKWSFIRGLKAIVPIGDRCSTEQKAFVDFHDPGIALTRGDSTDIKADRKSVV